MVQADGQGGVVRLSLSWPNDPEEDHYARRIFAEWGLPLGQPKDEGSITTVEPVDIPESKFDAWEKYWGNPFIWSPYRE